MKKLLTLTLFLVFCTLSTFGQSLKPDTIDYTYFATNKQYELNKVIEGKKELTSLSELEYTTLFFFNGPEAAYANKQINSSTKLKVNTGDTIMADQWDLDNKKYLFVGHAVARIKLNKTANTFTMEKVCFLDNPPKKPIIGRFKILKWTKTQVILLDLINLQSFRRVYYFKAIN